MKQFVHVDDQRNHSSECTVHDATYRSGKSGRLHYDLGCLLVVMANAALGELPVLIAIRFGATMSDTLR